jgi:hypothetical protein
MMRHGGQVLAGLGLAVQFLGASADSLPLLCLGLALGSAGLAWFHVSRGHPRSYTVAAPLLGLLPILGVVLGLLLKPAPAGAAPESSSLRACGIGMIFFGALFSIAPAREAAFIGGGSLLCGVSFLLAWGAGRQGWRYVPAILSVLGLASCGGMAALGMSRSELARKSREGATRGGLNSLRSALSVYKGDQQGRHAPDLSVLTVAGKYLSKIPLSKVPPYHPDSFAVRLGTTSDDSGGWLYDPTGGPRPAPVRVNCTHTDSKGTVWTAY